MIDSSKERNVANALKSMCVKSNFFIMRINTTGCFSGEKMVKNEEGSGAPDYILCHKGRFIGVECKSENGRQSERQKLFQKRIENAYGEYWIVKSERDIQALQNHLKSM